MEEAALSADWSRRRILFYGGCHADALAGIYRKFGRSAEIEIDRIVNYMIISQGIPFDYAAVRHYDAVVFSPIEKYSGYETVRLEDACARYGTRAISYPWLEWRGYHPFSEKGDFVTREAWRYPGISAIARETTTEDEFLAAVDSYFGRAKDVKEALVRTTEHLVAHETRNRCTLRVSDFILARYRRERLFLTPDHPAKPLYDAVVRMLNDILGLPFDDRFFDTRWEPQYGLKLSIHPRVAENLALEFEASDYQDNLSDLGERPLPLAEYLSLCRGFGRGDIVLRANTSTYLKRQPILASELPLDDRVAVPARTLLQGRLESASAVGHARMHVNWSSSPALNSGGWQGVYLFEPHWELRPSR